MDMPTKLLCTYMIVSFSGGMAVMFADTARGYRWGWAWAATAILCLPPFAIAVAGLAVSGLVAIWRS